MLSGQISKATKNTIAECNKLLKFAKDHKDVSLFYNYIGHPSELQLLCFFDAGFTARADGSSQGGYILMLVNKQLFTSTVMHICLAVPLVSGRCCPLFRD